jgi:hypothetical protein
MRVCFLDAFHCVFALVIYKTVERILRNSKTKVREVQKRKEKPLVPEERRAGAWFCNNSAARAFAVNKCLQDCRSNDGRFPRNRE